MKRPYLLALATTSLLLWAACGRATLGPLDDEPYTSSNGSGGTGAAGGSGGTSSNGGMGGTTDSVVSTAITATNVTNVSVSVGPTTCDMSGDCGVCAQCAQSGPCIPAFQTCAANPECIAFGDCLDNCMGQGCFPQCAQQFPNGVQDYILAVQCVVCDVCEEDCEEQAPPQLCEF
jgi:hypothetical protein